MLRISSIAKHGKQTCSVLEADRNKWWWFPRPCDCRISRATRSRRDANSCDARKIAQRHAQKPAALRRPTHWHRVKATLLHQRQFRALTLLAERVTSALERVAAAVVQDPKLMGELGLTEAERNMALVDPAFSTAGVTTRLDGFVHGDEIGFVESNAENPSSLPDEEELNRLLFELPAMASFSRRYPLRQFSPVEDCSNTADYLSRMGRHGRAKYRDPGLEGPAYVERVRFSARAFQRARRSHYHMFAGGSRVSARKLRCGAFPIDSSTSADNVRLMHFRLYPEFRSGPS